MAITTDDAIYKHGTNTEVINTVGVVSDGAFSSTGDATVFTNTDDAPMAQFVLETTTTGTPLAGTTVDLFVQLLSASSANPTSTPSLDHESIYLGSFLMDASGTFQVQAIGPVGLPSLQSGQQYRFFIKNNSGGNISPGTTVDIIPLTYGPAA